MSIGFTAARGSTYQASIGASTSRNVPRPSMISENGEAVRRIPGTPGARDDATWGVTAPRGKVRVREACQRVVRHGSAHGTRMGREP
ncbi:hypothetical protein Stsp02_15070 [Streptomyces sp. NBRC 14336]|nr:hypothetical protein Stsp02_15070 [Streptomyces sp. NBRC 14336]